MRKRGQMEMIGLVVIVILITLGMLFFAQFSLKEQPQKKIFTRKGLASSSMAALMKTSVNETNCFRLQIEKDILEDCAEYSVFGSSTYFCNSLNSCDFMEDITKKLLNNSLGQWNKKYEFISKLVSTGDTIANVLSDRGGCLGGKKTERDTSGSFFLNTDVGLVESTLFICE